MKKDPSLLLARIGAYPVGVFAAGALWALFDVFVLGRWEPKFGRGGTLQLSFLVVGALSVLALLVSGLVAYLLRGRTADWTARRHVLVGIAAGPIAFAILASGVLAPITEWLADRTGSDLVTVLGGCGLSVLVLAFVLVAGILAAGTRTAPGEGTPTEGTP